MQLYEFLDHTADVRLRIYGKDPKEVFIHAARGLFDLMAERTNVKKRQRFPVEVRAPSLEELLVAWLRELLYLSSSREVLLCEFRIQQLQTEPASSLNPKRKRQSDGLQLRGEVFGEKICLNRHLLKKEVKAVTYHGLSLKQQGKKWIAEVIFDV